jgi:hypothetical protein
MRVHAHWQKKTREVLNETGYRFIALSECHTVGM